LPLAIYHLSIKVFSRGKGASAVQKAAYRAGEMLKNDYDGREHDYTRKGGVVHTEIMLPDHAPAEYTDRAVLWNAVEKIEKAQNAQLVREVEFSLPRELTQAQSLALVRDYVKQTFVAQGMCADVCIHDKGDGNPHVHVMLTMRPINTDGTWGGKQKKEYILDRDGNKTYDPKKRQYKCRSIPSTDWNDRGKAEEWRAAWELFANTALEQSGSDERINHKSYERQGLDIIPTVHLGPAASQMERKGIRTERGNMNREIRRLRVRITKLQVWLKEEATNNQPPTLAEVINSILERREWSATSRLKVASQTLVFLQTNNITDMAGLEREVRSMQRKTRAVSNELKPIERRIGTLKEHIKHGANFKHYRKHNAKYEELYSLYTAARKAKGFGAERKEQKALDAANDYYESNRCELAMFDNAERYLRDVLQKHFDPKKPPPITKWQEELAAKESEKGRLYREYSALKEKTQKVETIKRTVVDILRSDALERTPTRAQGMETR
jgi:ATP-dependent exoDNAse (exonuclease V) alpha subunit